jgi:thiamine biosynthesis lipoprotein ApbE
MTESETIRTTVSEDKRTDKKSNIRDQITRLSSLFQDYLSNIDADVQTSRLLIEKVPEGTKIDFEFKAVLKRSGEVASKSEK